MKKLKTHLSGVAIILLISSCTVKTNTKELLKDNAQRREIMQGISSDEDMSRKMIIELIRNDDGIKLIADNNALQEFMARDEYHTDCPTGRYTKRYPDGSVKELGTFRRCKFYDSLRRFHANGSIEYETFFNDKGNEQGSVKYYYPNGQEEFVYEAKNGVPTGEATRYYKNGAVKETIYYTPEGGVMKAVRSENH